MADDAPFLPGLSPVAGKPVQVTFDAGRLTSDGGVLLLAEIERRLGIAERLAGCIEDPRAPERVEHGLAEMIRFRALLIAAGYEDGNDGDALRADPARAGGRPAAREHGRPLLAADHLQAGELARANRIEADDGGDGRAVLRQLRPGAAAAQRSTNGASLLDIDDTEDEVHGQQQLALFNAHYDSRCFLPIHIYEATTGKPVAMILRPGKTPDGAEVTLVLRHVVKAIRARWPRVDILVRGDSHYGRHEAMTWCERNRVGYVFGLAGNQVLLTRVADLAEDAAVCRAQGEADKVRWLAAIRYGAKTWKVERRVIARVEASAKGSDSRFIVTNLAGAPRWLYERVYCQRGQAENLIKAHKLHLASDRTSCTSATANQFRLLIHTAAYWLLHTLRGLAPKTSFWRDAQFDTIRLALIKVAARVTELKTRIKLALPTSYPHQSSCALLASRAAKLPP